MENMEERQVELWNGKRLEAFRPVKPTGIFGSYQILLKYSLYVDIWPTNTYF